MRTMRYKLRTRVTVRGFLFMLAVYNSIWYALIRQSVSELATPLVVVCVSGCSVNTMIRRSRSQKSTFWLTGVDFCYTEKVAKKYILYLIRWQCSSPILAVCLVWLGGLGPVWATIIANLIGGLIFFWVDKFIFKK